MFVMPEMVTDYDFNLCMKFVFLFCLCAMIPTNTKAYGTHKMPLFYHYCIC